MDQQAQNGIAQPASPKVGAVLRASREAAGLSIGDVVDRLKLSKRQLEAIENDAFEELPGAAFVRGFVRNYAKFLKIDPVPLMDALEAHYPSATHDVVDLTKTAAGVAIKPTVLGREQWQSSAKELNTSAGSTVAWGKLVVFVLLIAALGAIAYWWFGHRSTGAAQPSNSLAPMLIEQKDKSASQPEAATTPAAGSASDAIAKPASSSATQSPSAAVGSATASAAVATSASHNAAQVSPPSGAEGTLSFNVKQDAWVSVTDATGKKIQFGTLVAGTDKQVSGVPPFQVKMGNANQVELSYNGQPVSFADKIRGSTAKIELK